MSHNLRIPSIAVHKRPAAVILEASNFTTDMANVIEFYDIPARDGVLWSPNTRYALNYKGLEYKTKWIEFPDIESTCKKLGVSPTKTRRHGSPWYTLPVIYDPSTGVALADSLRIAEYLEKQYPDKPSLIPGGTLALHAAFDHAFLKKLGSAFQLLLPKLPGILNPVSAEFVTRTRMR
ncbi:hypothetical protein WG66_015642 [Moniliophthora roreri]|nr:hypothetical protein WG66_015642 [Moniliophthora roreri]